MKKIKRILDSVHGHLFIPTRYFEEIIDKDTFQRLKRIEQTSARSIFPSARHDRFIHSLGVYWIGRKIIDSFEQRNSDILSHPLYKQVSSSYLLACLLHDVGHSPFSHTFEKYYDNVETQKLDNLLKDTLQNKTFSDDLDNSMSAAPHEKLSAYLAHQEFGCFIDSEGADKELVVRMIIGCRYSQSNDDNGFRNAFIDLIHGDLIDADRLDYACRDVWASGYQTANIDMDRLIDSIYIE